MKIIFWCSQDVPDVLRQLVRPLQPIRLTKMSGILGVTQARWGNTLENDFEFKKIYVLGGIWKNTFLWVSGRPGRPETHPNYDR